jgi:prophage antirepressor-like protein
MKKDITNYRNLAESRGGQYLIDHIPDSVRNVVNDGWMCGKGHVFSSSYDNIRHRWCSYCSGKKRDLDQYIDVAVKNNCVYILETIPRTAITKVQGWRCNKRGHLFQQSYDAMRKGISCNMCNPFQKSKPVKLIDEECMYILKRGCDKGQKCTKKKSVGDYCGNHSKAVNKTNQTCYQICNYVFVFGKRKGTQCLNGTSGGEYCCYHKERVRKQLSSNDSHYDLELKTYEEQTVEDQDEESDEEETVEDPDENKLDKTETEEDNSDEEKTVEDPDENKLDKTEMEEDNTDEESDEEETVEDQDENKLDKTEMEEDNTDEESDEEETVEDQDENKLDKTEMEEDNADEESDEEETVEDQDENKLDENQDDEPLREEIKKKVLAEENLQEVDNVDDIFVTLSFENQQVRILGTLENPLFVAIDVTKILGYSDPDNATRIHVDPEDKTKVTKKIRGVSRGTTLVNQLGVYAMIFRIRSKLDSTKRFKSWLTFEVLPQIRSKQSPLPACQCGQMFLDENIHIKHRDTCVHHKKNVVQELESDSAFIFNSKQVIYRLKDRKMNATQLCQAGNKRFGHWYQNRKSKRFLTTLSERSGTQVSDLLLIDHNNNTGSGSWCDQTVALNIAEWVSSEMGISLKKWFDQHINNKVDTHQKDDSSQLMKLLKNNELILNNINITCRSSDGKINATQLCKAGGKLFKHWIESTKSQAFLQALSEAVGIPANQLLTYEDFGPNNRATWVHPQVAINIAHFVTLRVGSVPNLMFRFQNGSLN